jgi:hypothetical protein
VIPQVRGLARRKSVLAVEVHAEAAFGIREFLLGLRFQLVDAQALKLRPVLHGVTDHLLRDQLGLRIERKIAHGFGGIVHRANQQVVEHGARVTHGVFRSNQLRLSVGQADLRAENVHFGRYASRVARARHGQMLAALLHRRLTDLE